MTSPASLRSLAIPALLVLALSGCTTTGSGDTGGTGGGGDGGAGGGGATAADCAALDTSAEPKLALGVTEFVSAGPEEGQRYGDGTPLSVTLSEAGIAAGYLPMLEIYGPSDTGFLMLTSQSFDPSTGDDGTYSTALNNFSHEDYIGKAVIATVFAIDDNIEGSGGLNSANYIVLANYCITYAQ